MEFFKYKNKLKAEKGRLLISEPFLPDPNFERTVVLLCEHNDEGSFGFVLNKPAIVKVNDVMEELKNFSHDIFIGGPVQQDTLHFIHRNREIESGAEVIKDIFWGGNFENVLFLSDTQQLLPSHIKFFLGYSGWGPGQLDEELEENSWIVCDFVTEELMFETDPTGMWRKALGNMGGRFAVYANYPLDPNLN
jgi:putative transcriptional regulator